MPQQPELNVAVGCYCVDGVDEQQQQQLLENYNAGGGAVGGRLSSPLSSSDQSNSCSDLGFDKTDDSNNSFRALKWKRGELIGRGAHGKVYLAMTATGQLMAVKSVRIGRSLGRQRVWTRRRRDVSARRSGSGSSCSSSGGRYDSKDDVDDEAAFGDRPGAAAACNYNNDDDEVECGEHDERYTAILKSLRAEIDLMKGLEHGNIVKYLGTQITDKHLHIFMDYIPGGSISGLISKFGPLNEDIARIYTTQILKGLAYLHSNDIIHLDLKGLNVLVDTHGNNQCKLADFGASKRLSNLTIGGPVVGGGGGGDNGTTYERHRQVSDSAIHAGRHAAATYEDSQQNNNMAIQGTPHFIAPEVILQQPCSATVDTWSLGCTVIEMTSGKPPWQGVKELIALLFKIAGSDAIPDLPQHLSRSALDFLQLCFIRDPLKRPTAAQLLEHEWICQGKKEQQSSSSSSSSCTRREEWVPPQSLEIPVCDEEEMDQFSYEHVVVDNRSQGAAAGRRSMVVVHQSAHQRQCEPGRERQERLTVVPSCGQHQCHCSCCCNGISGDDVVVGVDKETEVGELNSVCDSNRHHHRDHQHHHHRRRKTAGRDMHSTSLQRPASSSSSDDVSASPCGGALETAGRQNHHHHHHHHHSRSRSSCNSVEKVSGDVRSHAGSNTSDRVNDSNCRSRSSTSCSTNTTRRLSASPFTSSSTSSMTSSPRSNCEVDASDSDKDGISSCYYNNNNSVSNSRNSSGGGGGRGHNSRSGSSDSYRLGSSCTDHERGFRAYSFGKEDVSPSPRHDGGSGGNGDAGRPMSPSQSHQHQPQHHHHHRVHRHTSDGGMIGINVISRSKSVGNGGGGGQSPPPPPLASSCVLPTLDRLKLYPVMGQGVTTTTQQQPFHRHHRHLRHSYAGDVLCSVTSPSSYRAGTASAGVSPVYWTADKSSFPPPPSSFIQWPRTPTTPSTSSSASSPADFFPPASPRMAPPPPPPLYSPSSGGRIGSATSSSSNHHHGFGCYTRSGGMGGGSGGRKVEPLNEAETKGLSSRGLAMVGGVFRQLSLVHNTTNTTTPTTTTTTTTVNKSVDHSVVSEHHHHQQQQHQATDARESKDFKDRFPSATLRAPLV